MNSYRSMISRITDIICENLARAQNYILIGDNSSGKSEVLREVLEREKSNAIYFIDSVNRTFDSNKVELVSKSYQNVKFCSKDTVSERIHPFNFNLRDTFHAAPCIEHLFDKYSMKIYELCQQFFHAEIQIVREILEAGLAENKVLVNGIETKLSSGYQAAIRLFCELVFFCDVMGHEGWGCGMVVIDELDEYFSPKYSARIFNFLQQQFPELHFLITTHSLDMVKCAVNADLIILQESMYEIYTDDELKNSVSVEDIFANLFFDERMIHKSDDDPLDEKLRLLLNLKISGLWDTKAQEELQELKDEKLQAHQKMIVRHIEEW